MAVIGKLAWCALMNPKTRTAECRSHARTRPPFLRVCRAPGGAGVPRGAAGPARHCRLTPSPSPPGHPSCRRRVRPSCGPTAPSARTRGRGRPDRARANQIDYLTPELRHVGSTCLGHGIHLLRKRGSVHESGSTPTSSLGCAGAFRRRVQRRQWFPIGPGRPQRTKLSAVWLGQPGCGRIEGRRPVTG